MLERVSSKKIFFWLFLIVFLWLAVSRFAETKRIFEVLSTGRWYWISLAIICQIIYYPLYAKFVDFVFRIFRLKIGWRKLLPVTIAAKFTDVALPVATFGTVAIFLRHSKKQNLSIANTGIGVAFALLTQVLAFTLVAIASFTLFYIVDGIPAYLSVAFYLLLIIVGVTLYYIVRLSAKRTPPSRFVLWVIKSIVRAAGQKQVEIETVEAIFLEIGSDVSTNRRKILPGLMLALNLQLINFVTLSFIYLAFVGHFHFQAILMAYVSALLFTIVSVTPQGVGVVETVMINSLILSGLDISEAAVITFVFRSLLYWLPVFAGFYFFSRLEFDSTKTSLNKRRPYGQSAI